MGHDIELKTKKGITKASSGISSNWSCIEIFHISEICGHRGKRVQKRLKKALSDIEDLGVVFPKNAPIDDEKKLFDYVKRIYGIKGWGEPVYKNHGFGDWGKYKGDSRDLFITSGKKDEVFHKLRVARTYYYRFLIQRFLNLAKENPKCYWYSDQCGGDELYGFSPFYPEPESESDSDGECSEEEEENKFLD